LLAYQQVTFSLANNSDFKLTILVEGRPRGGHRCGTGSETPHARPRRGQGRCSRHEQTLASRSRRGGQIGAGVTDPTLTGFGRGRLKCDSPRGDGRRFVTCGLKCESPSRNTHPG
jgi:hypothetical protein